MALPLPYTIKQPDIQGNFDALAQRLPASRHVNALTYTTATKPSAAAVGAGVIIFVSDGGAGAVFQGSNGAAWVNLG
jgi:hypothetical protein